jgi:hypothetical protein
LNRAYGIEMPAVTNGVLWGIDRVWEIGAHDPKKTNVRVLNKDNWKWILQSGAWGKQNSFYIPHGSAGLLHFIRRPSK